MPGRKTPLVVGEFYHLFNRGSEKRNIFLQPRDYQRFQQTFFYYQFSGPKPRFSDALKVELESFKPVSKTKLVEILCYTLMPNHFHFLVKQLSEKGISTFASQLSNSYTKYFNTKYERIGPLLQGAFKAVRIENNEQLIHTSRYIHLNPIVSELTKNLEAYQWSSCLEYINNKGTLCFIKEILPFFPNSQKYKEFLEDQIEYSKSLEIIKHLTFKE